MHVSIASRAFCGAALMAIVGAMPGLVDSDTFYDQTNLVSDIRHEGRFEPSERMDIVEREGVNVLCQAPTEYRMTCKRAELRPLPSLRSTTAATRRRCSSRSPGILSAVRT